MGLVVGLLSACLEPTQINVELTTNASCEDSPDTALKLGTLEHILETVDMDLQN